MKNLIKINLLLFCLLAMVSCEQNYQDLATENAQVGGLVNVETPAINYIIGEDAAYDVSLQVLQGEVKTTAINVWKSFTTTAGVPSNQVLLKTVDVTSDVTSTLNFSVDFAELRDGLTVDGADLPADDSEYSIGDFWTLSFQAVTSEGNEHLNRSTTKIAVATRLAGIYNIATGIYIHPSTAPDPASLYAGTYNRIVESVDPVTYRMVEIGPWSDAGNFFYFVVNDDLSITIPKEYNGATQLIWGADELANCVNDPNELPNVSCDNYVVLNDDGKDEIHISYGYIRDTGTRQFDDVLIKK